MAKKKQSKAPKPPGLRRFEALARVIAQVPKEAVDERLEEARAQHPRAKPKK